MTSSSGELRPGRFAGRVALVTGAAGGQGEAEVRAFAAEGASVMVADVLADQAGEVAADLRRHGHEAVAVLLDVADEGQWTDAVDECSARFGRLDVLVNNAGIGDAKGVVDQGERGWDRVMAVNVWGPLVGMRTAAPLMARSGGGAIINVSSMAGMTGYDHAAYTASKWALRGLTRSASRELADAGIRVNSVHPGVIITPMTAHFGLDVIHHYSRMNANRRPGTPDEIVGMVLHLASREASFTTGAEVAVDGGFLAAGANRALELAVSRGEGDP
ncbi:SDR family NAD(P)-dependent oxidoreductase [Aeromicrobium sp. HA]|uniref:SDR family NAD(P)-dependent oxidoreductase n=1 Tax=Aeromicrobium sp. HA TaxID=3009077 RepID=UPI0022AF9E46|nr:SDR family oxidoreductase [Aeromicrobium sp. HA]